MRLKQSIFVLVTMLSFALSAFSQEAVVVNSFEELKAALGKRTAARAGAARSAVNVTTPDELIDVGGTAKLGADIELAEVFTIGATYELTLDLNGYKFTPKSGTDYHIVNLGSFTIMDESSTKTGAVNCAIQNGNVENDYAYLEIQGGTVNGNIADGAAVTNYGECIISGGKFFSEYIGLTNYNTMNINGGNASNVYIEGKTYSISNSSALSVANVVIAGTEDSYLAEGAHTESFENVTYYNVALNGKGYTTLQEAVEAAEDGDLIRLFGDIDEDATVTINKAITLDGNGKALSNAIKVTETTGRVEITGLEVSAESEYALQVESAATVKVTDSKLSGYGAVKAVAGSASIKDTDLAATDNDVIFVATDVVVNMNGGSITASKRSDDAKFFIIGGAEGCTGAQLSIMTENVTLGGAVNYVNLDTDNNTVKLYETLGTDLYDKGYAVEEKGISLTVYNAVANVDGKNYRTLAEALTAAADASTVKLLWADYKAPISMAGTVCGDKTVTVTGTAQVDWSKGWFYVGRNGEGNGKVIFNEANLTSASAKPNSGIGINVSGSKKGDNNTNDGAVVINNSTIDLDYLINKGTMSLDNSTLTVKNGFSIGGRPASETVSGQDATATISLANNSKVVVNNHNGMGLGYEAIGVMNVDATSAFETTQSFLITAKGTMNVNGGTVKITGTLTNNGNVYVTDAANLAATVTGEGWFYMNGVSLDADTELIGAKVGFINGTNNVVGSTLKDGWFSVGIGQNAAAEATAAFAQANGITLGDVTVNVSGNATIYTSTGDAYSGWVGSAYSADKTQHTYTLNITNSLARFGYMHVSKDGVLSAKGHSDNKYEYSGNSVDFYVGNFIDNGNVTLDGVDAWAQYSKISVDHADAVLNIINGTKYEANCTTGNANDKTFLYYKAGTVNVDNTSSVNIGKATTLVEGAKLNIAGNVTAQGTVTGNGTITLTDTDAVFTAQSGLTVSDNNDEYFVQYIDGAYRLYRAVAIMGDVMYASLQEAIDACVAGDNTITLVYDVTEDVTITQKENINVIINGAKDAENNYVFNGVMTVFGNGRQSGAETLVIKNINFVAKEGAASCIVSPDKEVNNLYSYSHNVTVENCTFTDPDGDVNCAAIRHEDGGDKNWTVKGCTVDATMHSFLQVNNVEGKLVVENCTVNSKNGLNLNSCTNVELTNNTIEVKGYAVRTGVSSGGNYGVAKTYVFNNNTLKTDDSEGDAVIVFRASTADAQLSMKDNVVSGTTHISGNTAATQLSIDANYWDGKEKPVVSGVDVFVNSYYTDAAKSDLQRNEIGTINAFVYSDRITGDVTTNASKEIKITILGADGNVIGTVVSEKAENLTGNEKTLTWRINLGADDSGSWAMTWNDGAPSTKNMPAKVKLTVDGEEVAEATVNYTYNGDGQAPVFAAKTDADDKILSFIACDGFDLSTANTKLQEVATAAVSGDIITLMDGEYELPLFSGKELTFKGISKDGVVVNDAPDARTQGWNGSTFHFENLTAKGATANYHGLANGVVAVTYKNCNINGLRFLYANEVSFEDCTFNAEGVEHSFWTYGASNVTVKNSTFTYTDRAVNCYSENGADHETDITFDGCSFTYAGTSAEPEGAVEINSGSVKSIDVDFTENCVAPANGSMWFISQWDGKKGDNTVVKVNDAVVWTRQPRGGQIVGYTNAVSIYGETSSNAAVSYEVKVVDTNGAVMGTTSLNNVDNIIDGIEKPITWNIKFDAASNTDPYWAMSWTTAPTITNMPKKVQLWIDGVMISESEIKLNGPDGKNPVFAAKTDADGRILSLIACDGFNLNTASTKLQEAAVAGDNVAILVAGTYSVPTGKDLTITGAVDGVVFDNIGARAMKQANVTFNNVTFDYYPNVNYTGLQESGNLVYYNCTINGQVFLYGKSEIFNNCTFNQESADAYNVWTYAADYVEFNNCIFNSAGKSVLVYNEGDGATDLVVNETEFNASAAAEGKAAIEIDTSLMPEGTEITVDDKTTATGFATGSVSGSTLWNDKKADNSNTNGGGTKSKVTVDGVVVKEPTVTNAFVMIAKESGDEYYKTFAEALDAVENGETIVLANITGSESDKEIDFTKDIEFTITGNAPEYALPVVTFQNATVNIKNAEILIPELDARQSAVINVVSSTVHDAGGNSIVKSYYNGTINIDENSTVYAMQVTTMGYINVAGTLNATWQTNVYGNGMITVNNGATFNTAALHLTAKEYENRDNTAAERVGKPATIIVDGATLNVGKVLSDNGADYSYNSSKGINVGTIDGKSAVLDIKNGGVVNYYMANGETANIGADGTVNVDASTFNVACRATDGTATLANNGIVNVTGAANLAAANVTGDGWFYMDNVSLDADTKLLGAKVRFASGTNTVDGSTIDDGMFQVGVGAYNGVDANVDTTNGVVVNVKNNAKIGSKDVAYGGWVGTGFYDTDEQKAAVMNGAKYVLNIDNSIAEFGYLHVSNDGELNVNGVPANKAHYNNSDYAFYAGDFIINGTANFNETDVLAIYTKVSCDNGTDKPGTLNINAGTEYEAERHNGAISADSNFTLYKTGIVNVAEGAELQACEASSIAADANLNIAGNATVLGTVTNNGTINFTSLGATLTTPTEGVVIKHGREENYKIVYRDGVYKFGDFVAEIDGEYYTTLEDALKDLTDGATLKFLNNVTVAEAWDCRSNGAKILANNVTIYGNGKTLELTGAVDDRNWNTVFRFEGDNATVKNLTVDASEATGVQRGISAKLSITVDNFKFIGNGTTSRYGVIFGEGAGSAIADVVATVTNSEFVNSSYGVSDNRNGQDAKNVTVTGNKFQNSKVLLSASEKVEFNDNVMNGGGVNITSYSNASNVVVNAAGNTLDAAQENLITTNPANWNVQDEFAQPVATSNNVYYLTLPEAIKAVAADATVTLLNSVTGAGAVIDKDVTIDFAGYTYTFNEGVGSGDLTSNGFQILKGNTVTLKNGTLNVNADDAAEFYTIIQNYADLTVEDMTLDGTNLDKWSATDGDSYVLSNNSGNVVIKGNTTIIANDEGDKAFAFDACTYQGYDAPVVTVETTGHIAGLIESTATIVIKSGTYTMDVTEWCAEGLTAEPVEVDGELVYTIVTGTTFIDGQFTAYNNAQDKEVEYIRYERTSIPTTWTPFYVPFEVPVSQLAELGFEVAYINGVRRNDTDYDGELDKFVMEVIYIHGGDNCDGTGKTLKANYPYFIRSKGSERLDLVIELTNATLYATQNATYDCTTFTEKFEITGNASQIEINSTADALVYGVSSGEWTNITTGATLKPFRFYMTLTSRDGSAPVKTTASMSIVIRGEELPDGTTLIYDIEAETGDEFIFDLTGRRVLETEKGGIYIKNGKKVLVK